MTFQDAKKSAPVVLIEFYASWCPHCQRMMPIVAKVKEQLEGKASVYQYDIDQNREAADAAGVESIPTFIVFVNGKEVWRNVGEMEGQALLQAVQDAAKKE